MMFLHPRKFTLPIDDDTENSYNQRQHEAHSYRTARRRLGKKIILYLVSAIWYHLSSVFPFPNWRQYFIFGHLWSKNNVTMLQSKLNLTIHWRIRGQKCNQFKAKECYIFFFIRLLYFIVLITDNSNE